MKKSKVQVQNVECFVAGIIKGLKENKSISRYFGSTLSLGSHFQDAMFYGLVDGDMFSPKLTEKGLRAYEVWKLDEMPEGRSYLWPRQIFNLNEVKPMDKKEEEV